MPNWIKNRIDFQGERAIIEKVFEFIKGERGLMDFNKVIPMPESYRKYDTTNHPNGVGIEDQALKLEYIKATREQMRKYGEVGMTGVCVIGEVNGMLLMLEGWMIL